MSKQWFDVGNAPTLTIACEGSLWISAQTDSSLVISAEKDQDVTVQGTTITAKSDVRIAVPMKSSILLTKAGGSVKIKGVRGSVDSIVPIQGDGVFVTIDGAVTLMNVQGELRVRDLKSLLVVNEVGSDFKAVRIGSVRAKSIKGDCLVQTTTGDISIDQIDGEASVQNGGGELLLAAVNGDCLLDQLGGIATVNCRNDLRIKGSLILGQHLFSADSSITLLWPAHNSLRVVASAPTIVNHLPLMQRQESAGKLSGTIGSGNPTITLSSKNRIALRPESTPIHADTDENPELQLDSSAISEEIKLQVSSRLKELAHNVPTQPLNSQVERVLRKAQETIDQLMAKMEQAIAAAEQRAQGNPSEPEPEPILKVDVEPEVVVVPPSVVPTEPPATPPSADSRSAAQLKLLELLEKGVISADEAKGLLASLR